jgi:hypothetical protein
MMKGNAETAYNLIKRQFGKRKPRCKFRAEIGMENDGCKKEKSAVDGDGTSESYTATRYP